MNAQRRALIAAASAAAGLSLSALGGEHALVLAAITERRTLDDDPDRRGELLDHRALADLRAIAARLIPTTTTPGAADVDAHGVADRLLARCHGRARQAQSLALMERLRVTAGNVHKRVPFHRLTSTEQTQILQQLEAQAPPFEPSHREAWQFLKSLLVFAYCTSEPGATQLLAYDPLPGTFNGSVPYADVGKAWFE